MASAVALQYWLERPGEGVDCSCCKARRCEWGWCPGLAGLVWKQWQMRRFHGREEQHADGGSWKESMLADWAWTVLREMLWGLA
jgi:hypothetical protein